MQYNVTTPKEYLDALDNDWRREKLMKLRDLIKAKGPALEEEIKYKMLSYRDEEGDVFQLNAQKNYVSLYVGNIKKIDPDGELLKGANLGKGCIRFSKTLSLPDTHVDTFIEKALQLRAQGKDIGC